MMRTKKIELMVRNASHAIAIRQGDECWVSYMHPRASTRVKLTESCVTTTHCPKRVEAGGKGDIRWSSKGFPNWKERLKASICFGMLYKAYISIVMITETGHSYLVLLVYLSDNKKTRTADNNLGTYQRALVEQHRRCTHGLGQVSELDEGESDVVEHREVSVEYKPTRRHV